MDYEVKTMNEVPTMEQYPFPFAELGHDEFLDNFMPRARFFHYPTPVPYYECDDMDDMDWVNY